MDKKVVGPIYGSSSKWDKHLIDKSKAIKDKDFDDKVKWNDRINRALVHIRPNMVRHIVKSQNAKMAKIQRKMYLHNGIRAETNEIDKVANSVDSKENINTFERTFQSSNESKGLNLGDNLPKSFRGNQTQTFA